MRVYCDDLCVIVHVFDNAKPVRNYCSMTTSGNMEPCGYVELRIN